MPSARDARVGDARRASAAPPRRRRRCAPGPCGRAPRRARGRPGRTPRRSRAAHRVPGATTSRASSSASMTGTPRRRSRAATVLLPEAMPPVSPKRCTRLPCAYTFAFAPMREATTSPQARRDGACSRPAWRRRLVARGLGRRGRADARLRSCPPAARSRRFTPVAVRRRPARRAPHRRRPTAPATPPSPRPTTSTSPASSTPGWPAWPRASAATSGASSGTSSTSRPSAPGFASRFTRLGAADQDRVLASSRRRRATLLRAGFDGLKIARLHGLLPRPAHLAHRRLRRAAAWAGRQGGWR